MPSQTAENSENENLTFEKVWAAIQESDRKSQESRQKDMEVMREFRESMQESWQKDQKAMQELREQMDRTDRKMKETDKLIGDLGNRFGELAEHMVAPSIMEKFNELGFNFTDRSENHEIKEAGDPDAYTELDILLENGEIAVAVEVKAKARQADVDEHLGRMEILRKKADRRHDGRKFQGAIAGAIMSDAVRRYALRKGLYVIVQTGDTVRIDIPEGFKPREW